ncbi:unnamed protein product [Symbiodinium sp. KB8]|nr:unnamed protein product [Symbiodinium sp. KB8]|mmetsp:Transcript_49102/g.116982  ORF Transcript_49102/g.116982 Transcript_49102/m.116982 type:complete len:634 (-) Transcript_49102:133-2034(-)|eukprot:CAMPEP_0181472206 /NCGR_PEP_ID=MMETSP1110-20121109/39479_1 /TAXON_ID=174948 /ORGANISM="Symbiodinium sp., Strain CCMP421" /LENGTH=633 /DNA_ID=CAMNT_0023597265 /DNA_START=49 /DNA_END=1950 /DNA_ORIENTATION=-
MDSLSDEKKCAIKVCGGGCCLGWLIFFIVLGTSVKYVNDRQQVVYISNTGRTTEQGPFTKIIWPTTRHEIRDAIMVTARQYAVLKHERTQLLRHEPGPGQVFMDAWESLVEVKEKIVLQKMEYVRLIDRLTGLERVEGGPQILVPEPREEWPSGVETSIVIGQTNAVLVENKTSGMKRLVTAKGMFVPEPYDRIQSEKNAVLLEPLMYAVVKDHLTGQTRNELGPQLLQVGPYEEMLNVSQKWVLEKDSYLRLVNGQTGEERVERGPAVVVPMPVETAPEGKQKAVYVDSQTAVKVLNRQSGQQRLDTTQGVFIPLPYERILETQRKILVLPHQACVTRDIYGAVTLKTGAGGATAFFLPPYTSLMQFSWSSYSSPVLEDPVPKVSITMIDLRAQKMFFQNEVRTSDNVKLKLEGTIFWQVRDVMRMVSMTSDAPGDISQRARSGMIQEVGRLTLAEFMNGFNNLTQATYDRQVADVFYSDRGVEVQSLEITRFDSVDNATAAVLQEIIKETTLRINELQKQESQNAVNAAKLAADIRLEQQRTALIQTQADNTKLARQFQGQSAGAKLVQSAMAFIAGLNESVPNVTERVELYKLHQTLTARNSDTASLSQGKAQIFMTPDDFNLNLGATTS